MPVYLDPIEPEARSRPLPIRCLTENPVTVPGSVTPENAVQIGKILVSGHDSELTDPHSRRHPVLICDARSWIETIMDQFEERDLLPEDRAEAYAAQQAVFEFGWDEYLRIFTRSNMPKLRSVTFLTEMNVFHQAINADGFYDRDLERAYSDLYENPESYSTKNTQTLAEERAGLKQLLKDGRSLPPRINILDRQVTAPLVEFSILVAVHGGHVPLGKEPYTLTEQLLQLFESRGTLPSRGEGRVILERFVKRLICFRGLYETMLECRNPSEIRSQIEEAYEWSIDWEGSFSKDLFDVYRSHERSGFQADVLNAMIRDIDRLRSRL